MANSAGIGNADEPGNDEKKITCRRGDNEERIRERIGACKDQEFL